MLGGHPPDPPKSGVLGGYLGAPAGGPDSECPKIRKIIVSRLGELLNTPRKSGFSGAPPGPRFWGVLGGSQGGPRGGLWGGHFAYKYILIGPKLAPKLGGFGGSRGGQKWGVLGGFWGVKFGVFLGVPEGCHSALGRVPFGTRVSAIRH